MHKRSEEWVGPGVAIDWERPQESGCHPRQYSIISVPHQYHQSSTPHLTPHTTVILVQTLVYSHTDYSNSLLFGLSYIIITGFTASLTSHWVQNSFSTHLKPFTIFIWPPAPSDLPHLSTSLFLSPASPPWSGFSALEIRNLDSTLLFKGQSPQDC